MSSSIFIADAKSDSIVITRNLCQGERVQYAGQTFSTTGNYRIITRTSLDCDSIIKLTIFVNPEHIINLAKTICAGQTYTVGTRTFSVSGIYQITLKNIYNCDSIVNLDLEVKNIINPTVTIDIDKAAVCSGETVSFTSNITGIFNTVLNYQWFVNNNPAGTNANTFSDANFRNGDSIKLEVSIIDTCGSILKVSSNPIGVVVYRTNYTKPIVEYCLNDSFNINLQFSTLPSSDYSIKWTNGSNVITTYNNAAYSIQNSSSGYLSFEMNYGNNCVQNDTINFVVDTLPSVDAITDLITVKYDDVVQLDAITSNISSFIWSPLQYLNTNVIKSPIATIKASTIFTVQVRDNNNCFNSDSVLVKLFDDCKSEYLYVPTAFSPNNDGVNDCFYVINPPKFLKFHLSVFNRWNEIIFDTEDANACWDGDFNGRSVMTDSYVYLLKIVCANGNELSKKGTVSLLR